MIPLESRVSLSVRSGIPKHGKRIRDGMAVSVLLPPEAVWGYDRVTSAYSEAPAASWQKITDRMKELFPEADDKEIIRLIGKEPV